MKPLVTLQTAGVGRQYDRFHRAEAEDESDAAIRAALRAILSDRDGHVVRSARDRDRRDPAVDARRRKAADDHLAALVEMGSATRTEFAERMGVVEYTAGRYLRALRDAGLAEAVPEPNAPRGHHVPPSLRYRPTGKP